MAATTKQGLNMAEKIRIANEFQFGRVLNDQQMAKAGLNARAILDELEVFEDNGKTCGRYGFHSRFIIEALEEMRNILDEMY